MPTTIVTLCDNGDFHEWLYYGDITEEIVFRKCQECGLLEKTKDACRWIPQ
jgi:hypothetical protein